MDVEQVGSVSQQDYQEGHEYRAMDRIMNVNWWNPIWICVTIRISIMQVPGCNGLVVCPSSRHPDVFVSHMQLPSR